MSGVQAEEGSLRRQQQQEQQSGQRQIPIQVWRQRQRRRQKEREASSVVFEDETTTWSSTTFPVAVLCYEVQHDDVPQIQHYVQQP
ncbi:hypothetical protein Hamer_G015118 [Homarus americanus]|uniref:Uncharacterized protein n=1 Tax=Homarus americanus TaxID=6706 RepID=A0A8J5N8U4_HOMAM|nr:hypothetical protein Hamer_G015118 [Homarus americanus]